MTHIDRQRDAKPALDRVLAMVAYECRLLALDDALRRGCTRDVAKQRKALSVANSRLLRASMEAGNA